MSLQHLFAVSAQLSAAACAAVALALGPSSVVAFTDNTAAAQRAPSLSPSDAWDTFSADVTIRRHLLTADGTPSAEAPTVRYRWTRSQRAGGWKSTIELTGFAQPKIRSRKGSVLLDPPSSVVRIEDDEDGTPVRVFDRRGQPIRLPSIEDRRILGEPVEGSLRVPGLPELAPNARRRVERGRDWVDAFIAAPGGKAARQEALKRRFGRAAGRVRDLDRFVTADEGHTMEVLADRASGVPLEINIARDGALVAHSTVSYESGADGTLRRRAVHTEQRMSPQSEQRSVVHLDLTNLRLERRGVR